MGYDTSVTGYWIIDRPLNRETIDILNGLSSTRRVMRDVSRIGLDPSPHGTEGEFYFGDEDESVVDHNRPPGAQPGLWCPWMHDGESNTIRRNRGERFYNHVRWIEYIIEHVLVPMGKKTGEGPYVLNGSVSWVGEFEDDRGCVSTADNVVDITSATEDEKKDAARRALARKQLEALQRWHRKPRSVIMSMKRSAPKKKIHV